MKYAELRSAGPKTTSTCRTQNCALSFRFRTLRFARTAMQSRAHATTVVTILTPSYVQNFSLAKYCVENSKYQTFFCSLACHRRLNTLSCCRVVACRDVKNGIASPAQHPVFKYCSVAVLRNGSKEKPLWPLEGRRTLTSWGWRPRADSGTSPPYSAHSKEVDFSSLDLWHKLQYSVGHVALWGWLIDWLIEEVTWSGGLQEYDGWGICVVIFMNTTMRVPQILQIEY